jgi:hypothetical protein
MTEQRAGHDPRESSHDPAAEGVDTGLPNEDLHGTAREVEERADTEGPAETPGGG